MKKKDIPEAEPVETIEDQISAALDAQDEVIEDEPEIQEPGDAEDEPDLAEADEDADSEPEDAEVVDAGGDGDGEEDAPEVDLGDSEGEEPAELEALEAPEHWAATDREVFSSQPRDAQEFILERHKSMEGDYTRKSQENASIKRRDDAITDALAPYANEFAQAGLDQAGAVRQLASWHDALRTGGQAAVLQLAQTYGIDMTATEDQEFIDPNMQALRKQVADLKTQSTRQEQAAQQDKQTQLLNVIQAFETETSDGKLTHPHFKVLQDDITRLFQAGIAADLPDAYTKALSMRPDLAVAKPTLVKTDSKKDQIRKVAKAKKAATGVKSSGAVSKKSREGMTLEQEISSHMQ